MAKKKKGRGGGGEGLRGSSRLKTSENRVEVGPHGNSQEQEKEGGCVADYNDKEEEGMK